MASKNKNQKGISPRGQILYIIHRLIEFIGKSIFSLLAFIRGPKEDQPPINDLTLLHSATTLAFKIRNKQLTSEQVVRSYIERIKEIQPVLNCVVEERFKEALLEAKQCDEMLESPNAPSAKVLAKDLPFLGVPFTTKDCFAVANMKQTAGLFLRKNFVSEEDAEVVKLMKEAGAIPLAKTNVSEIAMWWESYNCVYGTTKNPYDTRRIVGGSSGGEGCIQAAAGSPIGVGSDIGGSIRMPCFFNGIFGHKPSKGIVSSVGHYPTTHSENQNQLLGIGPMCRFAQDMKPILKILADKNADKLNLDDKVDVSKIKFYYMEDDGGQLFVSPVSKEIKCAMKKVLLHFEKVYKIKPTKIQLQKFKRSLPMWFANMTSKDKDFSYELANRNGHINIWWEFIKCLMFLSNHTLIAVVTAIFERLGIKHGSEQYIKLIQESRELSQEFQDILGEDGVFLFPTHPTAAPLHNEPLVKPFNFSYTAVINVLGLPATACPLGLNKEGIPIGIQVVGSLNQDRLTLTVAEEIEKAFGGWVPISTIS